MQPNLSPTPRSMEQGPANTSGGYSYEVPPNYASPETLPTQSPENYEQRSPVELAPPPPAQPAVALPQVPVAVPVPIAPDPQVGQANPVAANDDDVIEKEWVDRAKQVIVQTKNEPYTREKALGELQRDYLMKRYGKQIGVNNDT